MAAGWKRWLDESTPHPFQRGCASARSRGGPASSQKACLAKVSLAMTLPVTNWLHCENLHRCQRRSLPYHGTRIQRELHILR